MNQSIVKGIMVLGVSGVMLMLWVARAGSLPLSAYRTGQWVFLPFVGVITLIGLWLIYTGMRQRSVAGIGQASGSTEQPEGHGFQFVSESDALALEQGILTGSPFAPGTALPLELVGQAVDFEASVMRETALGGLLAAYIMLAFGVMALVIFPLGAVLISIVGGLLGVFGLTSRRPYLGLLATFLNLGILIGGMLRTV